MAQLLLGAESARRNRVRPSASAMRQLFYRNNATQPALLDGPLARAIERLSRKEIEHLTQALIDRLDMMDGDPDLEDNGDHEGSDGDCGDVAWYEWDQHEAQTLSGEHELLIATRGYQWRATSEDDEDGDPAGGNPDDEGEVVEYAGLPLPIYGVDQTQEPLNHREVWHSYTFNPDTGVHSPRFGRAG